MGDDLSSTNRTITVTATGGTTISQFTTERHNDRDER
jgi:hypothetical protein